MKKYVNILDLALPYLYEPWDLEKFRILPLYMGLGSWKNSTPEPEVDIFSYGTSHQSTDLRKGQARSNN